MAHPYHEHRQHKVEKHRAHRIAGGRLHYADGGAVHHIDAEEDSEHETDRRVARDAPHRRDRAHQSAELHGRKAGGHVDGHKGKHRLDRKHRKRGGGAYTEASEHKALTAIKALEKHEKAEIAHERSHRAAGGRNKHGKGKHVTNVIVAPQGGGGAHPVPVPVPAGPPPAAAMPPRPPVAPPPGAGGPPPGGLPPGLGAAGPGGLPPGMRKRGGRVGVRNEGPGDRMPKDSHGWSEGNRNKTPVQHTDGKDEEGDIGRGKPITYRRGGKVHGVSHAIPPLTREKDPVSRPVMQTGKIEHNTSRAVRPASGTPPKMTGGSKSGVGRLEKMHAERRDYP